mgnify:CR=1 FL=1
MNAAVPMKDVLRCNHTGALHPYTVSVGLDTMLTLTMHEDWSRAKADAIQELRQKYAGGFQSEEEARQVTAQYGLTDFSWDWPRKIAFCSTNEYEWFYLMAEGKAQAVCIIYHPQSSIIDGERIFYIDYIASAYWNRNRPSYQRKFSAVGTKLISYVIEHATVKLGYRPGFSLHSLPSAETYYSSLGITAYHHDVEKEGLRYFEASTACANNLLEARHA